MSPTSKQGERESGQWCGTQTTSSCSVRPEQDAERAQAILEEWLHERGLIFSPEKTRIVHLSEGFDFLGFNIRHYRTPQTTRTGWKLLTKPSKNRCKRRHDLKRNGTPSRVQRPGRPAHAQSDHSWLGQLSPHGDRQGNLQQAGPLDVPHGSPIRQAPPSQKTLGLEERKILGQLKLDRNRQWVFGDTRTGAYLLKFKWFPIERHILVKGRASPDDPALKDYGRRRNAAKAKDLTPSKQKLAQRQQGLCPNVPGKSLQ